MTLVEYVARAMAVEEGDGWSKPWSHWLARAEAAVRAVRDWDNGIEIEPVE